MRGVRSCVRTLAGSLTRCNRTHAPGRKRNRPLPRPTGVNPARTTALALAVPLLLTAGCGAAAAPSPHAASPAATTAPAAQATYAPPAPDPCGQFATWASNGGQHEISAVSRDWTALQADVKAGNAAAVAPDGRQVAIDSLTALNGPPMPIAPRLWRRAMRQSARAGEDLEAGNWTAAEKIPVGALITSVTTAIQNQGCQ